jgi:hypothetical protein
MSKRRKKFEVGERRFPVLKKDEVKRFERGPPKMATFALCRWAQFVEFFDEIVQSVTKLVDSQQEVKLQLHVVADWYVRRHHWVS